MYCTNISLKTLRFDIPEFIPEILKGIGSGLSVHYILKIFSKLIVRKRKDIKPVYDYEKNYMLANICKLYESPNFEIENPTMNRTLINIMYDLSIELLLRYTVPNHRMRYITKNYSINTSNKLTLINGLEEERNNPDRHDSRFRMGFRNVFILISDNLEKIEKAELKEILNQLKPFFNNYSRKDLLNHYAETQN